LKDTRVFEKHMGISDTFGHARMPRPVWRADLDPAARSLAAFGRCPV